MDEQAKARLLEAAETIKNFCDSMPCNCCPFEDGFFCELADNPCGWNIAVMKERLEHDQTDGA